MRIALAQPPIRDFYTTPHRLAALGLKSLADRLKACGHEVSFFNFPLLGRPRQIPLPQSLNYLEGFILPQEKGPTAFFKAFKHFGPGFEECACKIKKSKPVLLAISSFAYAYAEDAIELAKAVKRLMPELLILAGGPGPTALPETYLFSGAFDAVFSGEAEESLPLILAAIQRQELARLNIPGLFLKESLSKTEQIPHLSEALPPQASKVWPIINYSSSFNRKRYFSVSLVRGCPKACRFCSNHLVQGHALRQASLEDLEQYLRSEFKPWLAKHVPSPDAQALHFNFEDDNLLLAKDFWLESLRLFKSLFPSASLSAENGLDHELLDTKLALYLIKMGFTQFNLSLVSIYPAVLAKQGRSFEPQHFCSLVKTLARRVPVICYFIAGFKEDSPTTIAHTIAFLARLPVTIGLSPFYALPGLRDFKDKKIFLINPPRLCLSSSLYPWHNSLSTQTLVTAFRLCRTINLLRLPASARPQELLCRFIKEKRLYTFIKEKRQLRLYPVPNLDQELVELFFKSYLG